MTVKGQTPKSTISAELNVHRLLDDDAALAGFCEHSAQVWRAGCPSVECFGHGSAMGCCFVFDDDEEDMRER